VVGRAKGDSCDEVTDPLVNEVMKATPAEIDVAICDIKIAR